MTFFFSNAGLSGTAIPDSAIAHFPHGEGSGSTLGDDVGTLDGTINGPTWQSGTYVEGYALEYDISDDYVEWSSFYSEVGPSQDYSVAFTLETGSDVSSEQFVWQHCPSSSDRATIIVDSGEVIASHYNGSSYAAAASGSVSTNTKYRVFYVHTSSENGTLYLNDTEQSGTTSGNAGAGYHTLGARGDGARQFGGRSDDLIVMDAAESASTVTEDYDRQPWS